MSSFRTTRGDDVNFGEITGLDDKRAQWGMLTAGRVLDCLFPEISLGDGNSVRENTIAKNPNYDEESFTAIAREYFQNIYELNSQGIPITPDIEDFCMFAKISRGKFMEICTGHNAKMSTIGNNVRNAIATCKKQMALTGQIPPVVFAIDFNNNHDYVQARNQLTIQTSYDKEAQDSIDEIASRIPIEDTDNTAK